MNTISPSIPSVSSNSSLSSVASVTAEAGTGTPSSTFRDSYEGPSAKASTQPTKAGKYARSRFISFTRQWENEPNKFLKLIQVPILPVYARIDAALAPMAILTVARYTVVFLITAALAPLVPLSEHYRFFFKRSVDTIENPWMPRV